MARHYQTVHNASHDDYVVCMVAKSSLMPAKTKEMESVETQTITATVCEDEFTRLGHIVYEKYNQTECLGCNFDTEFAEFNFILPNGHEFGCQATPAKVVERYLPLVLSEIGFNFEMPHIIQLCVRIMPVIENIMTSNFKNNWSL